MVRPDWAEALLLRFARKRNIRDRHFNAEGNLFLQLEKMGGAFTADLVHPSPTAHAAIADALIQEFNKHIRPDASETFGGFSQPIPLLDCADEPDGDMLDRVAEDDLLLEHMIKKDFGDPAHRQYGRDELR